MGTKLVLSLIGLAALGWYSYQYATNPSDEEVEQKVTADVQASNAYKEANPDYGPGGVNMRISKSIATHGVIKGYLARNTNMDTLTTPNNVNNNQPAAKRGERAGFTRVDFEDPLIGKKNEKKGIKITIPKQIPNRYHDSSGR